MKAVTDAIIAKIKSTGPLAAFAGVGKSGQVGPFWDIAPEQTPFPYMVIGTVGGMGLGRGFGPRYIAPVHVQFTLRDTSRDNVATNAETFCRTFDALPSLLLANGEVTRIPLRIEEPRFIAEGIGTNGERVYAAVVQYKFQVQRTIGV